MTVGYTESYGHDDLDLKTWRQYLADVACIVTHLPARTEAAGGYYRDAPLEIARLEMSDERVSFNGAGGTDGEMLGHETFVLTRSADNWSFCKTERKPYTLVVQAALIRLWARFGAQVHISGDGRRSEWAEALALCERLFGPSVLPPAVYHERDFTNPTPPEPGHICTLCRD